MQHTRNKRDLFFTRDWSERFKGDCLLSEKANDCEFDANRDERILEHLQTTQNRSLIQKAINKKWDLTQFLTEAAQIEDTTLQISDMKIPQEVKKLGRQFQKWRPPKNNHSGQGKQPCEHCGQSGTRVEGKNCPAYGKNVSDVRSSITSVQCVSPRAHPMAGKAKSSNVNKRNQRIKGTSAVLREPQKKMLKTQQVLMISFSVKP